ncbi:hypothetical protein HH308_22450 [Gordonia sp. TBRC 11910]|uniref:Uncharacterized protein n=1 Tax=Gordonia asplenii TaxID=2725283 RepID=A0A848KZY1_9ACTN|nr:hypothetical protein [Gordonia asplenii]NMO03979.1 hypothetical protein [Gordonia asplenii]
MSQPSIPASYPPVGPPGHPAAALRRPPSLLGSAVGTGIIGFLMVIYSVITGFLMLSDDGWSWISWVFTSGSGLQKSIVTAWLVSVPLSLLLTVSALLSPVGAAFRAIAALLLSVAVLDLLAFTLTYLLAGSHWAVGENALLFTLAWGFPIILIVATVAVAPTYFFGWSYFRQRRGAFYAR